MLERYIKTNAKTWWDWNICWIFIWIYDFCNPTPLMNSVLIGSFIIIFTGIIDDINPVPAKYKVIGQFLAALIVVCYGGLLIKDLSAFGFYIDFGYLAYPITILFIWDV